MDIERVRNIEKNLNGDEVFRSFGEYGMTTLAMLVAAIPGMGPAGVALDKVQQKLFEPDFKNSIIALSQELASIAPQLDSVGERMAALEAKVALDGSFEARFRTLLEDILTESVDTYELDSNGGKTNVANVIINDMKLHSVARSGGTTNIHNVKQTGSAKFETGPGSEQNITGSTFSSRRSGFSAVANFNTVSMQAGSTVEVAPPDANIGVRVTRVFGPDDEGGAAMTISPSGVVFGGNGGRKS
jgi:hypothetical protein